jgi:hypothetical protein
MKELIIIVLSTLIYSCGNLEKESIQNGQIDTKEFTEEHHEGGIKHKRVRDVENLESGNGGSDDVRFSEETTLKELISNKEELIELKESISLNEEDQITFNNTKEIEDKNSIDKYGSMSDQLICINNGSSRHINTIGRGTGGTLYVRFTRSNWNTRYNNNDTKVKNTCGNFRPSNGRFTYPDSRMYQYQMTLVEEAPGAITYFLNTCQEDKTFYIKTKKGFTYYIYTNDTRGDHKDNRGYISYCYGGGVY